MSLFKQLEHVCTTKHVLAGKFAKVDCICIATINQLVGLQESDLKVLQW